MQELNWRDAYTHGFLKLQIMSTTFEQKLEQDYPDLYFHIIDSGASLHPENDSLFQLVFPHFQSIFLKYTPMQYSGRIIDIFLIEGEKLILDIYQRFFYLCANQFFKLTEGTVK